MEKRNKSAKAEKKTIIKETASPVLNPVIFAQPVRMDLLAQTVRVYLANQRAGTAAVKTRGQVRGGGRKPWRQKGTGRARQGSIRAPQWVGGGVVHGPQPKDWSLKLPAKMRRAALLSALALKARAGAVRFWEPPTGGVPTKELVRQLRKSAALPGALLILGMPEASLARSGRNVPGLSLTTTKTLNPYAVLKSAQVVFSPASLKEVEQRFAAGNS